MPKTYGVNMADKHLVVGSIEVLNEISGNGVKVLQNKIDSVQQQQVFTPAPVNYWSELISDGVISPIEKKTIKQQWEEIAVVKTQLEFQAEEQEKTQEVTWRLYVNAYNALYNYLFQTLKLFDDMSVSTPVENRDLFNEYFSTYYGNQSAAQILLTQGEPGRVRTLKNLHEAGYDGEIAMYNNWFYTYSETYQQWESVPNDEYLGVCGTEPKSRAKNQYFLSNNSFITSTSLIMLNKKVIMAGTKRLKVSYKATPGNIYVWDGKRWVEDENRNSYRYLIATNDIITNGGEVSPNLETLIKGVSGTEGYLGLLTADPVTTPPFNSYYVYIGQTTDTRVNGTIYMYKSRGWQPLDPTNPDNYGYYMKTLKDTLGSPSINVGTFSTLFCNVLAANNAFITALFTKQITLLQDGYIQSSGYTPGSKGFKIKANGQAEFNEITIGGGVKVQNAAYADNAGAAGSATDATNATNVSAGEIRNMILGGDSDTEVALKSDNWNGPTSADGFGILKNGSAYFNNGTFRGYVIALGGIFDQGEFTNINVSGNSVFQDVNIKGNSKFEGEIDSGPLKLNNEGTIVNYSVSNGERFSNNASVTNIVANYQGYDFTGFSISNTNQEDRQTASTFDTHEITSTVTSTLRLYGNGTSQTYTRVDTYVFRGSKTQYPSTYDPKCPIAFTYQKIQVNAKTFKLMDLPTIDPQEVGKVWRDGTLLRISNG